MITKAQVVEILDRFQAYSVSQNPEFASYFASLMSPLYSAVETYFSTKHPEMEAKLKELVHNLYCDVNERNTQNEFNFGDPLPTDFPETYNDIRKCFYQFPLQNVTDEQFYSEWVIGVPPLPEGSDPETAVPEPEQPLRNTLVDSWVTQLSSAKQDEVNEVISLLGWLQNSSSTNDLPNLLEDTGIVLDSPSTQRIGKDIYQTKGMLEIIQTFGFQVYIPSYLGSDVVLFAGTFPSVLAMEEDETVDVGKYVLISSNDEENGNLYIRTETEFRYIANIRGQQGERGATFKPEVDPITCTVRWTNDCGLENPTPVCIKGDKGDKGDVGSVERIPESFIDNLF